jgi:hypothetical protein
MKRVHFMLKIMEISMVGSLALCILSTCICVIIPSEENIYKIAGVTAQQKAQIDASGKVVK